jgi:hypothetical protein
LFSFVSNAVTAKSSAANQKINLFPLPIDDNRYKNDRNFVPQIIQTIS